MSLALVWKDLSLQQVETVSALLSDKAKAEQFVFSLSSLFTKHLMRSFPNTSTRWLSTTFKLSMDEDSPDAIIIDFYYYNLVFAEECGFTAEKISTFFSIMKQTFLKSCGLLFFLETKYYPLFLLLLLYRASKHHC